MSSERRVETKPAISSEPFGTMPDGQRVECFTLTSATGAIARILSLGATLQSLCVPDSRGHLDNVALGCATVSDYRRQRAYLGSIVGRYANRIANASFELEGVRYQLSANEAPHTLHGGVDGFDRRVWTPVAFTDVEGPGVELELVSPDDDQGFPGTLTVRVRYLLIDDELQVRFLARTDKTTVVNLTSHAYWNLAGEAAGSIDDHVVWLNAREFTPVDSRLIPTGAIELVEESPFDFSTRPVRIGERIESDDEQLRCGDGYDHNFVLASPAKRDDLRLAAKVLEPRSRRTLSLFTTLPGLQFYSGNQLDGSIIGSSGVAYHRRSGMALEPQLFPDAPNRPRFPFAALHPGEQLRATILYRFGVDP